MSTQTSADDRESPPPDSSGHGEHPSPRDATEVPVLLAGGPPLLTPQQQELLLGLLLRGASPAGACQQLGLSVFSLDRSLEESKDFARGVGTVYDTLSRNVLAALYRAAMEGNVSAQTFWLKCSPPAGWERAQKPTGTEAGANDELSDRELVDLARKMGIDVPPEIEGEITGTVGPPGG
jgi:hypothetical protein